MNGTSNKPAISLLPKLAWATVFALIVYFIFGHAIRLVILTPESCQDYYGNQAGWVLPHVFAAVLALLIGPVQFSKTIRTRSIRFHRITGRIYMFCVLVGSLSGMILAATSTVTLVFTWGLAGLSTAWLTSSGMALLGIKKRKIDQHIEWMIRSYVVTFAFVTFRLGCDILGLLEIGENIERISIMIWASWAVPLLFLEIVIQSRRIFR